MRIVAVGDQGLAIRLGERIDVATGERVLAALRLLDEREGRPAGVVDVVPGYTSVLVVHEPEADVEALEGWIERRLDGLAVTGAAPGREVALPVLYDPRVAPDLAPLAEEKGMTVEALVAAHTSASYRCYLLGFRPGFPFLGGLDPRLHAPRLATPRLRVAAGSVGIGGQQTGVYPVASPGGWRIIGRTPARLFDPARPDPFLVHPGDAVRFRPVGDEEFLALGGTFT